MVITRTFDASRTRVFKAWTEPAQFALWWGPHGFTNPVCELDVRPGGAIRIDMRGADGTIHTLRGAYLEVVEPERLVFTASSLEMDAAGNALFLVQTAVTFKALGEKTEITVHNHVRQATAEAAQWLAGMEAGWTQNLERLAAYLGGERTLLLSFPSDRETAWIRSFNAPRALVWEAITKPEHVLRWMGPRFLTMPVCEIDLRVGGTWRYIHRAPDGSEYAFSGVYRELGPPERLISTELYEAMPGHDYLVTLTLEEYAGTTTIRGLARYQSQADRDGHLQSGMEAGMRETYDRLGEHLATMA